jgi:uncharacterized protein (TIGR03083 family)
MEQQEIWRCLDEERADLADFLDTLTPQQWAAQSLCEGWTVRDVAAHITQSTGSWARYPMAALRSGFRFNAMMTRLVREDIRTPEEIVAAMRGMVGSRRTPPGRPPVDPLMDALVHGQDIAIPLGLTRTMPIPAAVVAAERLWQLGFPFNARKRFANVAFSATDAPFRVGQGAPVNGRIQDIVLVLAGRPAGLRGLSGASSVAGFGPE